MYSSLWQFDDQKNDYSVIGAPSTAADMYGIHSPGHCVRVDFLSSVRPKKHDISLLPNKLVAKLRREETQLVSKAKQNKTLRDFVRLTRTPEEVT